MRLELYLCRVLLSNHHQMSARHAGPSVKRQRTPVSPSPSPEPAEGSAGLSASVIVPPFEQQAGDPTAANTASANVLEPTQEAARRTLEERIRVAIDDLLQLATCASETQNRNENVVRLKV